MNFFLQCNLLYIQKTPDICEFLGINKLQITPETSAPVTTPSSKPLTNESNELPNDNTQAEERFPANSESFRGLY